MKRPNGNPRWILLALIALIAFGLHFWRSRPEPLYAGKPLSFWVRQLPCTIPSEIHPGWREVPIMKYMGRQYGSVSNAEAILAIQSIGTNSLPYLLRLLRNTDSNLKSSVAQTMRKQRVTLPEGLLHFAEPMRWQATTAFRILGTNAAVATDALHGINREHAPATPATASVSLILAGFGNDREDRWFGTYRIGKQ